MSNNDLYEPAQADDACRYMETLPLERLKARFEENALPSKLAEFSGEDVVRMKKNFPVLE